MTQVSAPRPLGDPGKQLPLHRSPVREQPGWRESAGSAMRFKLRRVDGPAGIAARLFSVLPPCFLRCRVTSASTALRSSASRSPRRDKMLGQRPRFLERPGLKGRDELRLVDQPVLQSEQAEEEIAIGIDGGHDCVFPERPAGAAGAWTATTVSLHRAMNRIDRIIAWPLV